MLWDLFEGNQNDCLENLLMFMHALYMVFALPMDFGSVSTIGLSSKPVNKLNIMNTQTMYDYNTITKMAICNCMANKYYQ